MYRLVFPAIVACLKINWAFSYHCETGWTNYGSNCFWKSNDLASHDDNLKTCKQMGASMVIIKTKEGNNFIKTFLGDESHYWLGGQQVKQGEKEFKWIDGSTLTYSDWYPGEPNDYNNRNLVCLDIHPKYQWYDYPCNEKLKQLCEKPAKGDNRTECNCDMLKVEIEQLKKAVEEIKTKSTSQNNCCNINVSCGQSTPKQEKCIKE